VGHPLIVLVYLFRAIRDRPFRSYPPLRHDSTGLLCRASTPPHYRQFLLPHIPGLGLRIDSVVLFAKVGESTQVCTYKTSRSDCFAQRETTSLAVVNTACW
jgi:hypothetical protein